MSFTFKALRFIAIVIFALFIASVVKLPWPANIVIGGLMLLGVVVIVIYDWKARRAGDSIRPSDRPEWGRKNRY